MANTGIMRKMIILTSMTTTSSDADGLVVSMTAVNVLMMPPMTAIATMSNILLVFRCDAMTKTTLYKSLQERRIVVDMSVCVSIRCMI